MTNQISCLVTTRYERHLDKRQSNRGRQMIWWLAMSLGNCGITIRLSAKFAIKLSIKLYRVEGVLVNSAVTYCKNHNKDNLFVLFLELKHFLEFHCMKDKWPHFRMGFLFDTFTATFQTTSRRWKMMMQILTT